jgi:hypothetical protein
MKIKIHLCRMTDSKTVKVAIRGIENVELSVAISGNVDWTTYGVDANINLGLHKAYSLAEDSSQSD